MAEDAVIELLEHWRSIPTTTISPDQPDPIAALKALTDQAAALRKEIEAAVAREKASRKPVNKLAEEIKSELNRKWRKSCD